MPAACTAHPATLCLPKRVVKAQNFAAVQESLTILTKASEKILHKTYIVIKYEK